MQEHLKLLGLKVQDVVTGFAGIVTTVGFDLYGCVQAVVTPAINENEKKAESKWFDTKRLEILNSSPVMAVPSFATVPGGESKPGFTSQPLP